MHSIMTFPKTSSSSFAIALRRLSEAQENSASIANQRYSSGKRGCVERVLVIDDEPGVLEFVLAAVRNGGYEALGASEPSVWEQLLSDFHPDLVITDYRMPDCDGFDVLARVRAIAPSVPVVMLTGHADLDHAVEAMRRGACDYVAKPVDLSRLQQAIQTAASWRAARLNGVDDDEVSRLRNQMRSLTEDALEALVAALDAREQETNHHSQRVSLYATFLASKLGIEGEQLLVVQRGALLHDIGKIGVPDAILLKPSKLNDEEWEVIRQHPLTGYDIVKGLQWLRGGEEVIRHHHERFDGKGYPDGLSGGMIPLGARIFSVIDTFDAITSDRPYRKAATVQRAYEEIRRCSGSQFDPHVVDAFLQIDPMQWVELAAELKHEITVQD
jgi:putative nucleotidyltransferase with HDIG domain